MTMTTAGSKSDQIYGELRSRLMSGRYQFGEVLSTYELAQEFGVSRRPVLDAAMRLASAGFIAIIPQVGLQVVMPDERQVREHFAVAGILEGAGAKLAAVNATRAQLADIDTALRRCSRPAESDDVVAFVAANRHFHSAVLAAGGNQRLAELAKHAWDLSDFYLQNQVLRESSWKRICRDSGRQETPRSGSRSRGFNRDPGPSSGEYGARRSRLGGRNPLLCIVFGMYPGLDTPRWMFSDGLECRACH